MLNCYFQINNKNCYLKLPIICNYSRINYSPYWLAQGNFELFYKIFSPQECFAQFLRFCKQSSRNRIQYIFSRAHRIPRWRLVIRQNSRALGPLRNLVSPRKSLVASVYIAKALDIYHFSCFIFQILAMFDLD